MPDAANLAPSSSAGQACPAQSERGGISQTAFSPWPRCCPWLVIGLGVAVGTGVGFSPGLFLLIGALCLLSGWLLAFH
jgi:hypothetical protein